MAGPPQASQSLADAARSTTERARSSTEGAPALTPRHRRISYFMLVRLVVLTVFTVVAVMLVLQRDDTSAGLYHGFVWGTLVVGFGLTIIFARYLPRVRDLDRFAWVQTITDIILAAAVVMVSGGADSGFVSLYLIAVLGAATMGGVRQTWATAAACTAIYGTICLLEGLGVMEPNILGETTPSLPPNELIGVCARTLAGLAGVTVLSSFLNTQLATSNIQVGDLRAMNENILRSLSSGIIGIDNDSRVIYFNPVAGTLLGLGDDDLQRPIGALLPGVEPLLMSATITDDATGRQDLEINTRMGRRMHVGLSCSMLRDGQGGRMGQIINFQDVTLMHDLAEQVRRSERLAAVGGLAASVAHELRNPLAAISGSAELLDGDTLDDEDTRLLRIIRRETTRLSELVTDMLAFTRPRAPQPARTSLRRVAAEAIENFRADPASAELTVSLDADDVPDVEVDPAQLSQVLWNLLRNAGEAMDGKSGRVQLRLRTRQRGQQVELSVR
ncbi:MAG: PAS domain-containing protein, partial [Deltaproteobacteria bacterium]|nr:PAS domain-containing protein [Deltaproteobacteria bacterium]